MAFNENLYNSIVINSPNSWWRTASPNERLWFSAVIAPIDTAIDIINYCVAFLNRKELSEECNMLLDMLVNFTNTQDASIFKLENRTILISIAGAFPAPCGNAIVRLIDALEWLNRFRNTRGWELGFASFLYYMDNNIAAYCTSNIELTE